MTFWWPWKWRNEMIFNNNPSIPMDQGEFIMVRCREVRKAMEFKEGYLGGKRKREEVMIRWTYPREGWVKLNNDGATKGNPGPAGGGGLIRGHRGEFVVAYAMSCGRCMCTKAELNAVVRGLLVAWHEGFKKVQISIDSTVVVRALTGEFSGHSPYVHIVRRCKELMKREGWVVSISHCYREANRDVDWLANDGVNVLEKCEIIRTVPKDLHAILLGDMGGLALPRLVPAP